MVKTEPTDFWRGFSEDAIVLSAQYVMIVVLGIVAAITICILCACVVRMLTRRSRPNSPHFSGSNPNYSADPCGRRDIELSQLSHSSATVTASPAGSTVEPRVNAGEFSSSY